MTASDFFFLPPESQFTLPTDHNRRQAQSGTTHDHVKGQRSATQTGNEHDYPPIDPDHQGDAFSSVALSFGNEHPKRLTTKCTPPARTDRPYLTQIRALELIFWTALRIYTPGTQNELRGQMREVKDHTTDLTKASATPQTKKRLPPRPRRPIYRRLLQAIWSEQTKVSKRSNTVA